MATINEHLAAIRKAVTHILRQVDELQTIADASEAAKLNKLSADVDQTNTSANAVQDAIDSDKKE